MTYLTADAVEFQLGMAVFEVTNLADNRLTRCDWRVRCHQTSETTHRLVKYERSQEPYWVLRELIDGEEVPIGRLDNLFASLNVAKAIAVNQLRDRLDEIEEKIDKLRALPADEISKGGRFRKMSGEMVYIRLSKSGLKFAGLDIGYVWGVNRLNGNLAKLDRETLVVPVVEK